MYGYKAYSFKDQDPVVDLLKRAVKLSNRSVEQIANDSGVPSGTIRNWFSGNTRCPRFAGVQAVARSLHQEFRLFRRR